MKKIIFLFTLLTVVNGVALASELDPQVKKEIINCMGEVIGDSQRINYQQTQKIINTCWEKGQKFHTSEDCWYIGKTELQLNSVLHRELNFQCRQLGLDFLEVEVGVDTIIDELDWNIATESTLMEFDAIASVGILEIPGKKSRCSAFLISEDIIMTNHHCIPDRASAKGVQINLYKHVDISMEEQKKRTFSCEEFIGNNKLLDYALLKCLNVPGKQFGYLSLTPKIEKGREIFIIHQNCDFHTNPTCIPNKLISYGKIKSSKLNTLNHDADTLEGSSGAPIISMKYRQVLGIHNSGINGDSEGRGEVNAGIKIRDIIRSIKRDFPKVKLKITRPARVDKMVSTFCKKWEKKKFSSLDSCEETIGYKIN